MKMILLAITLFIVSGCRCEVEGVVVDKHHIGPIRTIEIRQKDGALVEVEVSTSGFEEARIGDHCEWIGPPNAFVKQLEGK